MSPYVYQSYYQDEDDDDEMPALVESDEMSDDDIDYHGGGQLNRSYEQSITYNVLYNELYNELYGIDGIRRGQHLFRNDPNPAEDDENDNQTYIDDDDDEMPELVSGDQSMEVLDGDN